MSETRPLPEFWYPLARMLLVLKAVLAATAPGAFGAVSVRVHRELRYAGAYLRRYLLALARTLVLPPPRPRPSAAPAAPRTAAPRRRPLNTPLALSEPPAPARTPGARPPALPCAPVDSAIALRRTEGLLAVLRHPLPAARRLARRLSGAAAPTLRALAVPWHVLRALPPVLDSLLIRLDGLARPEAWAGLDPDTG
jgi:hypothetical protein